MSEKVSSSKKNSPAIIRFFKGILLFICAIVVIFVGLCIFCALDKKSPVSAIPRDFSVCVRTKSAFETFDPLLDLQAADVAFASVPDLKKFRSSFMLLRSSPLRKNLLFKIALSRSVDAVLYSDESFLAVVDFGFLSILTRPLKFLFKNAGFVQKIVAKNGIDLQFVNDDVFPHFVFTSEDETGKKTETFFVPVKNLVCASSSLDTLMLSVLARNDSWTDAQKKALDNSFDGLRIIAAARRFADTFTQGDEILSGLSSLLPYDEFSVIDTKISDSEIFLDCSLPISTEKTSLSDLLAQKSTVPSVLSSLSDSVQYYTVLNAGSLAELKNALFPILPVKNIDSTWAKADFACRVAFGLSIEDLLFSWTGKEFAAFGIENQNDPVFALQIKDEKKRRAVFDKFVSSIFIKDDNSLILGGVRLPRLKLPSFLNGLLAVFGVEIPSPYYLVLDDFVYFSESPENLSAVFNSHDNKNLLQKTENWKIVSSKIKNDSTITLFYDLARSVPFFIRKNVDFANVLKLYTLGRFDAKIQNDSISLVLQASSKKRKSSRAIPGFPISLEKNADSSSVVLESGKNPQTIFWTSKSSVNALDVSSLEIKTVENVGKCALACAPKKTKDGVLWAVSESGNVYLCDKTLSPISGFPVSLGEKRAAGVGIVAVENGVLIPTDFGKIAFVDFSGKVYKFDELELSIKSSPTVLNEFAAVYDKSFFGGIYFLDLKNQKYANAKNPLSVDGIGFGSPAMIRSGKRVFTAFVTQAGLLTIWEGANPDPDLQKTIDGNFVGNLVSSDEYFYALSTDAVLHRIGLNGEELCVQIPHATAKNAHLCVLDLGKNEKGVFVNADSNVIYAFNEKLELLPGFPLAGSGIPVLVDVNGDKTPEIVSITMDKKIVAWKIR